jgi:hypothetical protein
MFFSSTVYFSIFQKIKRGRGVCLLVTSVYIKKKPGWQYTHRQTHWQCSLSFRLHAPIQLTCCLYEGAKGARSRFTTTTSGWNNFPPPHPLSSLPAASSSSSSRRMEKKSGTNLCIKDHTQIHFPPSLLHPPGIIFASPSLDSFQSISKKEKPHTHTQTDNQPTSCHGNESSAVASIYMYDWP